MESKTNKISIRGYLKENNLVETMDGNIRKITGNISIATTDNNVFKIMFDKKEGARGYEESLALLPANTISSAQYIKANPTATLKTAQEACTKVWASGLMKENCYKKEGVERSIPSYRAFSLGIVNESASREFIPQATFTVDVFINDMKDELDANNAATGRVLVEGLIPDSYLGVMHKFSFVAPKEDNIAAYVKKNYAVQDTVTLKGDLVNMLVKTKVEQSTDDNFFGRGNETTVTYSTTFVDERVIRGGSKFPIHPTDAGAIAVEDAKAGLEKRASGLREVGSSRRVAPSSARTATPKAAAPKTPVKKVEESSFDDGFDF